MVANNGQHTLYVSLFFPVTLERSVNNNISEDAGPVPASYATVRLHVDI